MNTEKLSEMEQRVHFSLLYDFYGALLKENARRMFEAYILEDYGYSEIAQEEGISRQGVYDAIHRAKKQLEEYEQKLGLVSRFQNQKVAIQQLQRDFQELRTQVSNQELFLQIEEKFEQMIRDE